MEYPHLFYTIEILTVLVFFIGILANLGFWFKGAISRTKGGSFSEKISYLLGILYQAVFQRAFLRQFSQDVVLERPLARSDPTRWPMHFPLFLGFCTLFFIGSLGDQLTRWGLISLDKDTRWFAFTNDVAGLLLLVGLLLALHRRYVLKLPFLKTFFDDRVVVLLLLVSLVSGYIVEGFRLLSLHSPIDSGASFVGAGLATILSPLELNWARTHFYTWWFHALVSLAFFAYIPYSRAFHLFATTLTLVINSLDHKDSFVGMAQGVPNFTLRQLIELSGCTRCGECLRVCETYKERTVDPIAPAIKLKDARSHLLHKYGPRWASWLLGGRAFSQQELFTLSEAAFRCTLCTYCGHVCPSGIDLSNLWYSVRQEYATGAGLYPRGFQHIKDGVARERNIFSYPNVERALWVDFAKGAPQEGLQKSRAQVLYFVGCVSSFSPLAQDIPQSFSTLMLKAGVDFTILGPEESCCGFPLMAAGMKACMEELRGHNIKKLKSTGADTVVFNCPSCYMTWKKEYAPFLEGVALKHSTEYIKELIKDGRLRPRGNGLKVTYHDPCDLGRNSKVYDQPREVISAVPGIDLREARSRRWRSICCGGGGVLEAADPIMASEISYRTYNSFLETGAEALVVACPQCKRMFQGAKKYLEGKMAVMDITELVLSSL